MQKVRHVTLTAQDADPDSTMKVIITGTTGYVGEGVMLSCLDNPEIEKVLSVSRRPCGHTHPKLEEYIVPDFSNRVQRYIKASESQMKIISNNIS